MLITLRQLQYIAAVAETGSFSKAAELCNADQSTVSQQIKILESKLNIDIFNREFQPIVLTPEGADVAEKAKEILDKVEDLLRPFKISPKKYQ
jgi:LysR family transcriptional regulator, hydrogen peroxide-inducible genes activator